jgi:hypothetical protein
MGAFVGMTGMTAVLQTGSNASWAIACGYPDGDDLDTQQDATIGSNLAGIEGGGDLLLADTWQGEREQGSAGRHGRICQASELMSAPNLYAIPDGYTLPTNKSLLCSE